MLAISKMFVPGTLFGTSVFIMRRWHTPSLLSHGKELHVFPTNDSQFLFVFLRATRSVIIANNVHAAIAVIFFILEAMEFEANLSKMVKEDFCLSNVYHTAACRLTH